MGSQMLRYAQHDTTDLDRYSSLSGLVIAHAFPACTIERLSILSGRKENSIL